jgi:thiamine pyrophosphate-dependent acetolactate synthase large subunit-like protein
VESLERGQGNRPIASTFSDMNFANIAKAMGVNGNRVEDPKDLAGALNEALASAQPTVVDVVTSFDPWFRDVTSPLAAG